MFTVSVLRGPNLDRVCSRTFPTLARARRFGRRWLRWTGTVVSYSWEASP